MDRAEIVVKGLVQGVRIPVFVIRQAESLDSTATLKICIRRVLTVVEGEKAMIEELLKKLKIGPSYAYVTDYTIKWEKVKMNSHVSR
jgi:acylphosphatase